MGLMLSSPECLSWRLVVWPGKKPPELVEVTKLRSRDISSYTQEQFFMIS